MDYHIECHNVCHIVCYISITIYAWPITSSNFGTSKCLPKAIRISIVLQTFDSLLLMLIRAVCVTCR